MDNLSLKVDPVRVVCIWHAANFGHELVLQQGLIGAPTAYLICTKCAEILAIDVEQAREWAAAISVPGLTPPRPSFWNPWIIFAASACVIAAVAWFVTVAHL